MGAQDESDHEKNTYGMKADSSGSSEKDPDPVVDPSANEIIQKMISLRQSDCKFQVALAHLRTAEFCKRASRN